MNERPFVLNNRYLIDPSMGSVKDIQTSIETRIEPRLMNLLCLLVTHNNTLVSRAFITKEIWDDYGNADEGLTQAISYLRKVLADDEKKLIETIPKKGYILHASISESGDGGVIDNRRNFNNRYLLLIAIVLILLAGAWLVFKPSNTSKSDSSDVIQKSQPAGSSDAKRGNPDKLLDTTHNKPANADKRK